MFPNKSFDPLPCPHQNTLYPPLSTVLISTHEVFGTPSCSSSDSLYSCMKNIVDQCSILHWPNMGTNRDDQENNLCQNRR